MYTRKQIWSMQCCMASHKEWHLQEAGLKLLKMKSEISQWQLNKCLIPLQILLLLYRAPVNWQCTPNIDCLAASNAICTKRSTTQFGLLLFESEVNNNSQTCSIIHLTSLVTFFQDSASKMSYTCERIIIIIIWIRKYEQNGTFQFWLKFTYHFLLLNTY